MSEVATKEASSEDQQPPGEDPQPHSTEVKGTATATETEAAALNEAESAAEPVNSEQQLTAAAAAASKSGEAAESTHSQERPTSVSTNPEHRKEFNQLWYGTDEAELRCECCNVESLVETTLQNEQVQDAAQTTPNGELHLVAGEQLSQPEAERDGMNDVRGSWNK